MGQVTQVVAPRGAHRTRQEQKANDALKEYESHRSEPRGMPAIYMREKILLSGNTGMMPQLPRVHRSERDEGPLDVADGYAYVVAVDPARDEVFWTDPLRL